MNKCSQYSQPFQRQPALTSALNVAKNAPWFTDGGEYNQKKQAKTAQSMMWMRGDKKYSSIPE